MGEDVHRDYFCDDPVFKGPTFSNRFRMSKPLFNRIVEGVHNHSSYFTLRYDVTHKMGHTPQQKCIAAMRMMVYGEVADREDEYIRMGQTTALQCLPKFCRAVIEVFGGVYLRNPNADDVKQLFQMHEDCHGFPGMLGSLDCMHWGWKNCPVGWKGQHGRGDHKGPMIMLEAVDSQDLWIWHAFFGVAGSNNDINILNRSPLFRRKLQGLSLDELYTVNNNDYTMGYYLTDGIYPEWAAFVKSIPHTVETKKLLFKQKHESAKKDVEHAFGVLLSRFHIIRGPCRIWEVAKIHDIMEPCVILHNMIVKDERHMYLKNYPPEAYDPDEMDDLHQGPEQSFQQFLNADLRIHSRAGHNALKNDLIEHIWQRCSPDLNT